ncbi:MAG: Gfo/Idh/MocA family oxidoreductase [Bacilli bacterium]|nr:Gfo/Idh/MocA family oxidoreductase [Bacilli bacterium]
MKKVRYGIIGVGNQGSYYASLIKDGKIPNAVLGGICDTNPQKITALINRLKLKDVPFFSDCRQLMDSKYVDAIIITTPHYLHPIMAQECFMKNIHVITDKPAGVFTRQVWRMNQESKKSKGLFGMMFNQRTNCVYRKMREIIANGGIGKLQRVTWIITDWFRTQMYYDSGSWRATWRGEGGGVLINQCPHQIDLISWVVGEMPKTVNAFCKYGHWHNIEVEDEVTAYFTYKNGATGVFITTTGEAPGTNRFEVSGTLGKLICENNKLYYYKNNKDSTQFLLHAKTSFDKPTVKVTEVKTDGKNLQHIGILRNFTNAILRKEKLFVKGTDGINGVELMNAIELSGWQNGKTVKIPVNEKVYFNELLKHVKNSKCRRGHDNIVEKALNFGTGQHNVKNGK